MPDTPRDGRECAKCGKWKTAENFHRTNGKLYSYCKTCKNEMSNTHYHETKVLKGRPVGKSPTGEDLGPTAAGRTCMDCKVWKTREYFWVEKRNGNLFAYCRECGDVRRRDQYANRRSDPAYVAAYNDRQKLKRVELRLEVIRAYGGGCACCGETTFEFLTLDHVNNDGAEHRRATGLKTGQQTWAHVKRSGYPAVFQILCWNCNSAKGAYGACPHEKLPRN